MNSNISGRETFSKYEKYISVAFLVVKALPLVVNNTTWNIMDNSESKIALLFRYLYLKKYAKFTGKNIFIGKRVTLKNIKYLEIGSNVSIHTNCYIDAAGEIIINNDVSIAHNTSLVSFNHTWDDKRMSIKYNPIVKKKIIIEDDVWIGNGCRILAGVLIQRRSIVAAGAVVNKEVKSYSVVGGIPAKFIKEIN